MPASLRSPSPAAGAPLNARWIIAGVFGAFWLLFAVGNASILFGIGAKPGRGQSMVPFIGGLAGAMACLASPYPLLEWAWVPLVLDVGSVPMLVLLAWHLLKPKKGGRKPEAGE